MKQSNRIKTRELLRDNELINLTNKLSFIKDRLDTAEKKITILTTVNIILIITVSFLLIK